MEFQDIIGQKECIHLLKELVDQNRLSHALLFIGKEGSGALPLALAFSTYVVTQSEKKTEAAPALFEEHSGAVQKSGQEASLALQYIHPDIHYSYPVISKKGKDKPISTDYIQEWRAFIQQNPYGNVYDWLQFIEADNKQGNISAAECTDIIRKLNLKSFESSFSLNGFTLLGK